MRPNFQTGIQVLAAALFAAAAANVVAVALAGGYDLRFGPIHLVASYLFKPLLYLNAAFLAAIALRHDRAEAKDEAAAFTSARFWMAAVAIVAVIYSISFAINLGFGDWTHRGTTSGVSPLHFFVARQGDGYYRPLGFLSLWIDNVLFGPALWAYHIQNIALHLVNGFLVMRLASRIGLQPPIAYWSGLLFLAVPASFDAVIWPGARFSLLATALVLLALERALAGSALLATAAFVTAVLCKESAYCYPLLLAAVLVFRRNLDLPFDTRRAARALLCAALATAALVAVRIAVYGNLGGYPDVHTGGRVNFELTPMSIASLFTRLPAALYMINSFAGRPVWLRLDVLAYTGALAAAILAGARLGNRAVLLLFAFLAELPDLNVVGWIQPSVHNGRLLYDSAIWIAMAVSFAVGRSTRASLLRPILLACLAGGALWNTLAYVKMLRTVDEVAAEAAAIWKGAPCGRTVILRDVPGTLYGAESFADELQRRLQAQIAAPVKTNGAADACTLVLTWGGQGLSPAPPPRPLQ